MFDEPLSEAELASALLNESETGDTQRTPSGEGDVVREDGSIRTCIIRPCQSRGRAIRNLRPIYTPTMLRENAGVFTNWPMFRDHAIVLAESVREQMAAEADARQEMVETICEQWMATTERFAEAVKKVGRSVDDLAGRVVRSWWDPDITFEDDATFGYQPGGVAGLSLLLPSLRESIAADAGLMHVSINGYPTGGKPGVPPWPGGVKGMVIEGIRKVPMGSVDVVVRGGAGGRFLKTPKKAAKRAVVEREVSPTQPGYGSPHMADVSLSEATTPDQLRAYLAEHAPHLATVLREGVPVAPSAAAPAAAASAAAPVPVTRADIDNALREAREGFRGDLGSLEEKLTKVTTTTVDTDRQARIFEAEAHRMIEAASQDKGGVLPASWVTDLRARYTVKPTGPMPALLVEAEMDSAGAVTKDAMTVLRETVEADLKYAAKLIAEAAGTPVVRAQGGAEPVEESAAARTGQKKGQSWATELTGMGILETDDSGKPKLDGLFEAMVS